MSEYTVKPAENVITIVDDEKGTFTIPKNFSLAGRMMQARNRAKVLGIELGDREMHQIIRNEDIVLVGNSTGKPKEEPKKKVLEPEAKKTDKPKVTIGDDVQVNAPSVIILPAPEKKQEEPKTAEIIDVPEDAIVEVKEATSDAAEKKASDIEKVKEANEKQAEMVAAIEALLSKDSLKSMMMSGMNFGQMSDFEMEFAEEMVDGIVNGFAESISSADDKKNFIDACCHNPEEAKQIFMKNFGNTVSSSFKKILHDVDSVFYTQFSKRVMENPDWLVDKGICQTSEEAFAIAEALKAGDYTCLNTIEDSFLNVLKAGLNNAGIETKTETSAAAAHHIKDEVPVSGMIDMTPFMRQPVVPAPQQAPQQPVQQPVVPPVNVQQTPITPAPQPILTKVQPKKEFAPAVNMKVQTPPVEMEEKSPKVRPDYEKKPDELKPNAPVENKPKAYHLPENDCLITQYPWLGDIETIANANNEFIRYEIITQIGSNNPSGLIRAQVYLANFVPCAPKSFTIDASGVMYDARPKFFPVLFPEDQKTYEDYPAYLIFLGGHDNKFDPTNVTLMLKGGAGALPKKTAYAPEIYALNKAVDLSTMPRKLMNSESRKATQKRIANSLMKGVFSSAFAMEDPNVSKFIRFRFKAFDPKTGEFTLTNVGCPWRFNSPCFSKNAIEMRYTADQKCKVTRV